MKVVDLGSGTKNVQTFGFVYRNTNGQNHGPIWKTQSFLLNGICMVILWQDYNGNGSSRKFYLNTVWKKSQIWECLSVNRAKGLSLSVCVDEIKLAGKRQNINPTWKIIMKDVELGEPTSFLEHVFVGCTQRQCQKSKEIVCKTKTSQETQKSLQKFLEPTRKPKVI